MTAAPTFKFPSPASARGGMSTQRRRLYPIGLQATSPTAREESDKADG